MPLPEPAELSPEVRRSYEALDLALKELRHVSNDRVAAWATQFRGVLLDQLPRLPELEHRLSPEMVARTPIDPLEPRTPDEIEAIVAARPLIRAALEAHPAHFLEALAQVHQLACGSGPGLRTGGVRSLPDKLGTYVLFPEVHEVKPGLLRLQTFIRENLATGPALAASVAMVSVCNLHPFSDGNGRLSRILFNALLTLDGRPIPYFPLHELGRVSRGGFLIAMRLAQYRGEWGALAGFLTSAIGVMSKFPDESRLGA